MHDVLYSVCLTNNNGPLDEPLIHVVVVVGIYVELS